MKYFLAVFFILFMAVSVFGFAGMTHTNHDGSVSGGCVTSILDSSVCVDDVLSMVISILFTISDKLFWHKLFSFIAFCADGGNVSIMART